MEALLQADFQQAQPARIINSIKKGSDTMSLTLSLACSPYDRILPLAYGRVWAEGIRITYLPMEVEEIFWRQLRNREFDIAESSFSSL